MPWFKSTYNILTKQDEDEVTSNNWFDSDTVVLPPKTKWFYDREMQIEDVDIWECLYESSGGIGIYAAWAPYAEFYLVLTGFDLRNPLKQIQNHVYTGRIWETYYGPGAQQKVYKRSVELGIPLHVDKTWVDPQDMWLHQPPEQTKSIILPNELKI
jgi:hypothetical protein